MKMEVMKVKGTQRAFYRIYVLPMHIEKRKGEDKEVLKKELAAHRKYVRDNDLQKELEHYLAAQQNRQDLYDAMQAARGKFAAMKSAGLEQDINKLAEQQTKTQEAELAFREAKAKFIEEYH